MILYWGHLALSSYTELYARTVLILVFVACSTFLTDAVSATESPARRTFGLQLNTDLDGLLEGGAEPFPDGDGFEGGFGFDGRSPAVA